MHALLVICIVNIIMWRLSSEILEKSEFAGDLPDFPDFTELGGISGVDRGFSSCCVVRIAGGQVPAFIISSGAKRDREIWPRIA